MHINSLCLFIRNLFKNITKLIVNFIKYIFTKYNPLHTMEFFEIAIDLRLKIWVQILF